MENPFPRKFSSFTPQNCEWYMKLKPERKKKYTFALLQAESVHTVTVSVSQSIYSVKTDFLPLSPPARLPIPAFELLTNS